MAKNRAAQALAGTRAEQERLADPFSVAGRSISVPDPFGEIDVAFTKQYSETFVISGGMDSPGDFGSEYDDPGPEYYAPSVTVHEITAAYDIGF